MHIEAKLAALGMVLPPPLPTPPQFHLPFAFVRLAGPRAYVAGHGPQGPDGAIAGPFGQVGTDLTVDQGYTAARLVALAMLGSLQRALGDLDRVSGWLRVFGMVNAAPGFKQHPAVINGFSDLILELYGPEVGRHARSAVGMSSLPLGMPVEIEAEVAITE